MGFRSILHPSLKKASLPASTVPSYVKVRREVEISSMLDIPLMNKSKSVVDLHALPLST